MASRESKVVSPQSLQQEGNVSAEVDLCRRSPGCMAGIASMDFASMVS